MKQPIQYFHHSSELHCLTIPLTLHHDTENILTQRVGETINLSIDVKDNTTGRLYGLVQNTLQVDDLAFSKFLTCIC